MNVGGLRGGHFTFDQKRLTDGRLVSSGRGGGRRTLDGCGFVRTHDGRARGRHCRTLWLPVPGRSLGLICRLPHGLKILPLLGLRITGRTSVTKLHCTPLSTRRVLWKSFLFNGVFPCCYVLRAFTF